LQDSSIKDHTRLHQVTIFPIPTTFLCIYRCFESSHSLWGSRCVWLFRTSSWVVGWWLFSNYSVWATRELRR